jgi:hypothetical protein
MPLSQIVSDSIENGAVAPVDLSSVAQYTGFKNRIINGGMVIDQRNAGAAQTITAGTTPYTVDRWIGYFGGGNGTSQRVGSVGAYSLRFTGGAGVNGFQTIQRIESYNIADLAGQVVTLSFTVSSSSQSSVGLFYNTPTAQDNYTSLNTTGTINGSVPLTATPTQLSYTFTLPANATNGFQFFFQLGAFTSGTFTLTNVQLEKGSTATSFDYRPYGTELALCQRYYQKSFPIAIAPAQSTGVSSDSGQCLGGGYGTYCMRRFAVYMRANPTITGFNPSSANSLVRNTAIGADIQAVGVFVAAEGGFFYYPYGTNHDANGGQGFAWNWTASAEL